MRISDWSSDVCSSDLLDDAAFDTAGDDGAAARDREHVFDRQQERLVGLARRFRNPGVDGVVQLFELGNPFGFAGDRLGGRAADHRGVVAIKVVLARSDEHTSELQSLMRISYAVFCLKKKK